MKKILITGASGFIGNFLIEEALKRNLEVFAAIRKNSRFEHLRKNEVNFIEIDYCDKDKLKSVFASSPRFDFIIHNAGITKAIRKESFLEINYQYTKNLIEGIIDSNNFTGKFLYVSSLAAVGPGKDDLSDTVTLSTPPSPITYYGISKLYAEQFIMQLNDFPYIIVRPTAVYGPGDKDFFEMAKLINNHFDFMLGSGKHKQDLTFIYAGDLARIMFDLLESDLYNKIYIASDGKTYGKTEMSDLIAQILKKRFLRINVPFFLVKIIAAFSGGMSKLTRKPSVIDPEKIKMFSACNWKCDITPLTTDIAFKPEYSLEQGLKETLDWYKKEGWIK